MDAHSLRTKLDRISLDLGCPSTVSVSVFYTGGIRFRELLLCEAVFLALFAAVASRSMLASHNTDNRKGSDWSGIGTIFVLEIVLNLGRIIAAVLAAIGVIVPNVLLEAGELMSSVSLLNWFANVTGGGLLPVNPLGMLAIYSSLTLYWLFKYRKVLYDRIGETPEPALESKKEKTKALKKRPPLERCWENALGWQSYVYYAGGRDNTTGRVILYGAALLFVLFSLATKMLVPLMVIILIGSGIVFLNAMNGTTHCFDKESKANTLGSLMMTPHNGLDLYRGWRSGILWLTIPDHVYLAIVMVAMLAVEPWVSYVILCLMITIHLSGPLLMLSGLVPIALKGLGTAFLVLFGLLLCVFFGVFVAWLMHPAAFTLGFMPLYAIFNSILLHYFVEHWLIVKIADEV